MFIRKNIRGITALLLALALLLGGCAKGEAPDPGSPAQPPVSTDKTIPSDVQTQDGSGSAQTGTAQTGADQPEEPPYAVPHSSGKTYVPVNGIEITTFDESADGPNDHYSGYYIQISGLKDENVEARVNARLKALYEATRDAEGYPDIEGLARSVETSDYTGHDEYISVYANANIGNIISVTCSHGESFTREDGFWLGYSDVETLTLDLNTGNEVKYTELFADDVHAQGAVQAAVSDAVSRGLSMSEEDGYISEDVEGPSVLYLKDGENIGTIGADGELKYYIDGYTGELMVIIDHELPQFDTGYYYSTVGVPMEGIHAYDQRFFNGDNIYTSDEQEYAFFAMDIAEGAEHGYHNENVQHSGADIAFEASLTYYPALPQAWNDYMQLSPDQKEAIILQEETYVDSVLGGLDPAELSCNVSYYNEASRFGEYTNLTRTVYYGISVSDPSQYISLINRSDTSSQVYYKDSAAPMQLSDVFKVGTEWPTMIHYCIQQNIKDLEPESEYTEEQLTEWANFLMNDITGFSLGSDYLTLYYEDIYHHAQEFFPGVADDEIWKFSTGPQMIHYEDLGYHILNIFR